MKYNLGLIWLRRDYRLDDNTAVIQALKQCTSVVVCFIYDKNILDPLPKQDQRIAFIMNALREVDQELEKKQSKLVVRYGDPLTEIPELIQTFNIDALFFNRDYEPYAKDRDQNIHDIVNVPIKTFKDSVVFEKDEVLSKEGNYYRVFTPYKNQWLRLVNHNPIYNESSNLGVFSTISEESNIQDDRWYDLLGFTKKTSFLPGGRSYGLAQLSKFKRDINEYDSHRDFPSLNKTSNLSPYIRFGCISIREMVSVAIEAASTGANVWLSELIWRDFYQMIIATHPNCQVESIKPVYDEIVWEGKDEWFDAWCNGQTGFPIVDAAMRQLNTTGLMHNRCRMIVASFLCKTLLLNWRKGEAYFAEKLLDFDFASNNGGWGWASSSGCDAQPYFRIFNPYSQSEKFDSNGDYIRTYCPELAHLSNKEIHNPPVLDHYPTPIVDYKTMRQRALDMYSVVKK